VDARAVIAGIFDDAIALHSRVRAMDLDPVVRAADAIGASFSEGGKLLVFGNGGSAADSQHMAAELVGRFARERAGLPAVALATDTSFITSLGNDYGFERVFARQIDALGRRGDVAHAISTSGASPNVLHAQEVARTRGLRTIALTGRDGGTIGRAAEIHINVPDASTARVQEVHITLIHAICELLDRSLEAGAGTSKTGS
jgi:D-sedoheptulose 7-phosphate isomerase